jgi:hypothetical protein
MCHTAYSCCTVFCILHIITVFNKYGRTIQLLCWPARTVNKISVYVYTRHIKRIMYISYTGLCTVRCTVRYAFYCMYRNFVDYGVNYGVITILEDPNLP